MESKTEEEVPSPHKAFVGGISWHTSEKDLREYFTTFGPVAHVNLMTKKRSQQPRGFAFVVFATQEGKQREWRCHRRCLEPMCLPAASCRP